ncbi:beta-galactosidase [Aureimonas leprariae]|uniref:Beta-galactosidase n=1 Tax=Plantimonas leprariae TaxID=2615207 RepID=A0A7V7PNN5_9HYPH|nr:beta-galactosidase [Aureimonas leprariae]KAB0679382.1 beta-galactosidase [Aureimonas leprariae]
MTKRALGVCYYPEHWPEDWWAEDARRMREVGIAVVRIGEFAWSRLEPARGRYDFDWLQRAIDTLHGAGLKVVVGTPTATPPKWLVDAMPDMLQVDEKGRPRRFGSRRHYCFSHEGYRAECARIVEALAKRFGEHEGVVAWQTDNEYGCHGTTISYSQAALKGFRDWLGRKYQSPDALNRAWGNVFWSMEYGSFEEIELPNLLPTDPAPAHAMDFRRYSSDAVVSFNRLHADIIRRHSPGRDVIHNFMGRTLAFDHFDVGADLDVSSWDSYPLGFLDQWADRKADFKARFARSGDPDLQAFHHDLYRATSGGRWWIMEQQPGPVNWAPHNPAPRAGMVRLWAHEAFAHGAEVVSYFRWRQAPFAQEQMHAGLTRPDREPAPGYHEAAAVAREIETLDLAEPGRGDAAIVFDYPSAWAWDIQRQGREFDYFRLVHDFYRGLRRLGLSVDFVDARQAVAAADYKLLLVPGLFTWPPGLKEALAEAKGQVLVGPRSGSKTPDFAIPAKLPPELPEPLAALKVALVETLRPDLAVPMADGTGAFHLWREMLDGVADGDILLRTVDGEAALVGRGGLHYLAGWPDEALAFAVLGKLAERAGLATLDLPEGLRLRRSGKLTHCFNYGDAPVRLSQHGIEGAFVLGADELPPSGVAILEAG